MPQLTTLQVYDNSDERDPGRGQAPSPRLLLDVRDKALRYPLNADELTCTPQWANTLMVCADQSLCRSEPARRREAWSIEFL